MSRPAEATHAAIGGAAVEARKAAGAHVASLQSNCRWRGEAQRES